MKKNQKLKISKETVKSVLDKKEMSSIIGGYFFSIFGCSQSLCVSHGCRPDQIGFTVNSYQCCSPK
ncbi:natural product precursor [Flavobacterium sp. 2755]|uniref:TIGR04149 family rSAM-modified RiPP n=1 Tax=Flavobacterium sp. 2755 TaxID=2817765 RepID=UPI0028553B35|nr:TIGR04149 family rSAM-modified RiPP [Flavobacterium sp. 2755]MDR6761957.1 natural product precursor [Flavobacterium sp. 2755]